MNENELIALERVAISARELILAIDGQKPYGNKISNLRQEVDRFDAISNPPPPPTAKEVIKKTLSKAMTMSTDFNDVLAGDIHEALVEAGYL